MGAAIGRALLTKLNEHEGEDSVIRAVVPRAVDLVRRHGTSEGVASTRTGHLGAIQLKAGDGVRVVFHAEAPRPSAVVIQNFQRDAAGADARAAPQHTEIDVGAGTRRSVRTAAACEE